MEKIEKFKNMTDQHERIMFFSKYKDVFFGLMAITKETFCEENSIFQNARHDFMQYLVNNDEKIIFNELWNVFIKESGILHGRRVYAPFIITIINEGYTDFLDIILKSEFSFMTEFIIKANKLSHSTNVIDAILFYNIDEQIKRKNHFVLWKNLIEQYPIDTEEKLLDLYIKKNMFGGRKIVQSLITKSIDNYQQEKINREKTGLSRDIVLDKKNKVFPIKRI